MKRFTISPSGGDFKSLNDAANFLSNNPVPDAELFLKKGIYYGQTVLLSDGVTLTGESPEETVITGDCYADRIHADGERHGTFRTATFFAGGKDFTARNITFANTAGRIGQALALYLDGDRAALYNCRLTGFQDTLFTGGLPDTAFSGAKHTGIKDYFNPPPCVRDYTYLRAYFERCFIAGDIDFIFGSSVAVFNKCTIHSLNREVGYVTAASTPPLQKYGFVFHDCDFSGDAHKGSVYLGRPWRRGAKTVVINSRLGAHIHPEGFHNWDEPDKESSVIYAEYNNTGAGYLPRLRAPFCKILSAHEAEEYGIQQVLKAFDGWNPVT